MLLCHSVADFEWLTNFYHCRGQEEMEVLLLLAKTVSSFAASKKVVPFTANKNWLLSLVGVALR